MRCCFLFCESTYRTSLMTLHLVCTAPLSISVTGYVKKNEIIVYSSSPARKFVRVNTWKKEYFLFLQVRPILAAFAGLTVLGLGVSGFANGAGAPFYSLLVRSLKNVYFNRLQPALYTPTCAIKFCSNSLVLQYSSHSSHSFFVIIIMRCIGVCFILF